MKAPGQCGSTSPRALGVPPERSESLSTLLVVDLFGHLLSLLPAPHLCIDTGLNRSH